MLFLQGAARNSGPAGACLVLVELDAVEIFLSHKIMAEVRDVLTRPRVRRKFSSLTDENVDRFLTALEKRAVVMADVPHVFQFDRDPKDEPYINLAIAARADYLVSRDKDILDLADASTFNGRRLREQAPDLQILEPREFVVEISRRLEETR
jgi:putative PIN family toxin of toxin-antitoxin system